MRDVFISKPNALNKEQQQFWAELRNLLLERQLKPRTIGETDFPNCTPLKAVKDILSQCSGIIVLGFRQIELINALAKGGTNKAQVIRNEYLPTTWNHIETGIGFMYELPMLIIREDGVRGGIFDVGNTDRFIHQAELSSGWLHSNKFLQPFSEWQEEVIKIAGSKQKN